MFPSYIRQCPLHFKMQPLIRQSIIYCKIGILFSDEYKTFFWFWSILRFDWLSTERSIHLRFFAKKSKHIFQIKFICLFLGHVVLSFDVNKSWSKKTSQTWKNPHVWCRRIMSAAAGAKYEMTVSEWRALAVAMADENTCPTTCCCSSICKTLKNVSMLCKWVHCRETRINLTS